VRCRYRWGHPACGGDTYPDCGGIGKIAVRHGYHACPADIKLSAAHESVRRGIETDLDPVSPGESELSIPLFVALVQCTLAVKDPLREREKEERDHTKTEEKREQGVDVVDSREDDGLKLHRISLL
jgi:hypothetical protein